MTELQSFPLRLLVVDDFAALRRVVAAALSRSSSAVLRNALVVEAADLAEARARLAEETAYDVVILDMSLPDGNGLDLARELAANPAVDGRPVVIAASGDETARFDALSAGCAAFLTKPYTPAVLVATLIDHCSILTAEAGDSEGAA